MKKASALILTAVFLLLSALPAASAQPPSVMPLYENADNAYIETWLDNEETLYFQVNVIGKINSSGISTVTWLQRKVGNYWIRCNVGTDNNKLYYETTGTVVRQTYTYNVVNTGEYRVVSEVTIHTASGDEEFTLYQTVII